MLNENRQVKKLSHLQNSSAYPLGYRKKKCMNERKYKKQTILGLLIPEALHLSTFQNVPC